MTSHIHYRDAAVLLSIVAPADLVRVLAMARAPGTATVSPRVFTWGLPAVALTLGALAWYVSGAALGWHIGAAAGWEVGGAALAEYRPGLAGLAVGAALAVLGAGLALGGELLIGAAPLLLRGRRPHGFALHRAFGDRPAVLAVSTSLTGIGEEVIYRGLWLGLLITSFRLSPWLAVPVAAAGYALNHWYLGAGVVRQKLWSGVVYGLVYLLAGGAVLVAVAAHVLHNLAVAGLARPAPALAAPGSAGLTAFLECLIAVAVWTALFRLPFNDARRRNRFALWLGTRVNADPQRAFAVFATALYLALAALVVAWLGLRYPLDLPDLFIVVEPVRTAALTLLAVAGTVAIIGLAVGLAYRWRPGLDVPGAVRSLQWLASASTLPGPARVAVPALGACAEELVFRGAVFNAGYFATGSALAALIGSALLFAGQQAALTSTAVQAVLLIAASAIIGGMGALLLIATGSLVPALVVHVAFAAFYSRPTPTRSPDLRTQT